MTRIAIFYPKTNAFYLSLWFSLKRAFEALGVEVGGWTELLGEPEMMAFIREFHPDVIFEMNMTRHQRPYLPASIRHVAWIVDPGEWKQEEMESDILYFFDPLYPILYCSNLQSPGLTLLPGTDPDNYFPAPVAPEVELSFVGHIPKPWTTEELNTVVYAANNQTVTFADCHQVFAGNWRQFREQTVNDTSNSTTCWTYLRQYFHQRGLNTDDFHFSKKVYYDLKCRSMRLCSRRELAYAAIASTHDLALYGTNWDLHPQYSPYYRGFLHTPAELRQAYSRSSINLHNGAGIHFRSLDCMASGGLLFYAQECESNNTCTKLSTEFIPDTHYVPFLYEELPDKVSFYRHHPDAAQKIRLAAVDAVRRAHTWRHRAQQILDDLNSL